MFDFFKSIEGRITAVIALVTSVVNFVILWQSNAGVVTTIMLSLFIGVSWFACGYLYFKKNIIRQPLQPTRKEYAYPPRVRYLARLGVWGIPTIVIASFFVWQIWQYLPPQNTVILVAQFNNESTHNDDFGMTGDLRMRLKKVAEPYSNIEIQPLNKPITAGEVARQEGKKEKATIVIWGWYVWTEAEPNVAKIHVYFEMPKGLRKVLSEAVLPKIERPEPRLRDLTQQPFILYTQQVFSKEIAYLSFFTLGTARYILEDWEGAINLFNDAVRQLQEIEKPESSLNQEIVYLFRGATYYEQGNYNSAIQDYDWIIDRVKNRVNVNLELAELANDAYYNRGLAFADQDNYHDAIESYTQAIALQSNDEDAYNNRGLARAKLRNYEAAIEDFSRAIELNPKLAEAYNNLGFIYAKLGEYDRALSVLEKALELQPEAHVYDSIGFAYAGKGDYKRAIAYYNKALKLNSTLVLTYLNRGRAYKAIGKREKAITDFKQVLKLSTDPELKQQATKQLQELGEQ